MNLFKGNFNKIFAVTLVVAFSAAYWVHEVVIYGKLPQYLDVLPLVTPIIFAYVFYSFIDILKSSVLVPAKMTKELLASFLTMLLGTVAFFFTARKLIPLMDAMALAMVFGTIVALILTIIFCRKKIGTWVFTHEHYILIAQAVVTAYAGSRVENLPLKAGSFILFVGLYYWAVSASKLVDMKSLWQKYLKKPSGNRHL